MDKEALIRELVRNIEIEDFKKHDDAQAWKDFRRVFVNGQGGKGSTDEPLLARANPNATPRAKKRKARSENVVRASQSPQGTRRCRNDWRQGGCD